MSLRAPNLQKRFDRGVAMPSRTFSSSISPKVDGKLRATGTR